MGWIQAQIATAILSVEGDRVEAFSLPGFQLFPETVVSFFHDT
jgi:hypothetical protein